VSPTCTIKFSDDCIVRIDKTHVGEHVLLSVLSTTTTTTTQAPVTDDNSYVDGPVIISTYKYKN